MPFRSPGRTQPDRRLPCQKMHMLWFGSNHSDAASRGTEKILQCLWFSSTRSPCDGGATCRDSHKFGFPSRPIWKRWFVPRLRRRLRPLCQSASGLDWKVVLFDFDQGALEFASNQLSISKTTSDLSSLVDDSFDVIWAYHVAEHWRSIDDSFNDLDRLIKPGGKLVIATPNARSWEKYLRPAHFKYYYQAWRNRGLSPVNALKLLLSYDSVFCWDPPRHLYAYTPESLHRIGARRGYSTELRVGANTDPYFEPAAISSHLPPNASTR